MWPWWFRTKVSLESHQNTSNCLNSQYSGRWRAGRDVGEQIYCTCHDNVPRDARMGHTVRERPRLEFQTKHQRLVRRRWQPGTRWEVIATMHFVGRNDTIALQHFLQEPCYWIDTENDWATNIAFNAITMFDAGELYQDGIEKTTTKGVEATANTSARIAVGANGGFARC